MIFNFNFNSTKLLIKKNNYENSITYAPITKPKKLFEIDPIDTLHKMLYLLAVLLSSYFLSVVLGSNKIKLLCSLRWPNP